MGTGGTLGKLNDQGRGEVGASLFCGLVVQPKRNLRRGVVASSIFVVVEGGSTLVVRTRMKARGMGKRQEVLIRLDIGSGMDGGRGSCRMDVRGLIGFTAELVKRHCGWCPIGRQRFRAGLGLGQGRLMGSSRL